MAFVTQTLDRGSVQLSLDLDFGQDERLPGARQEDLCIPEQELADYSASSALDDQYQLWPFQVTQL